MPRRGAVALTLTTLALILLFSFKTPDTGTLTAGRNVALVAPVVTSAGGAATAAGGAASPPTSDANPAPQGATPTPATSAAPAATPTPAAPALPRPRGPAALLSRTVR